MDNFPISPIPVNNLTSYLKRLADASRRLQPISSNTLAITETSNGIRMEAADHLQISKFPVTWEGEWDRSGSYSIGAMVYSGSIDSSTTFICVSPVPPILDTSYLTGSNYVGLKYYYDTHTQQSGINYSPVVPYEYETLAHETEDGNGLYWRLLGGNSGSAGEGQLSQCKITWMNSQNYFGAKKWNGTVTSSTEFMVAKSIPSRMPSSATIEGESFSYSYTNDNLRVSTAGDASTELQSMLQQFTVGDVVWVSKCDYTSLTHSGSAIKYIEVNTEREWVRRYSQTPP